MMAGRTWYAAMSPSMNVSGAPTRAIPLGDGSPSYHFLREQPGQRACTSQTPSVRLERRERDAPFQQRRDDGTRMRRIVGEDTVSQLVRLLLRDVLASAA